jgi:hypothetical protein
MRVVRYVTFLLAALACSTGTGLARCDSAGGGGVVCARLGEPFNVRVGETAYIADTRLSVRVDSVPDDSRCPRDAVCVWAGNARVSLTLRDASNTDDVEVNSTVDPRALVRWGYTVQLVDVQPTPISGQPIPAERYVARLVVTRASG